MTTGDSPSARERARRQAISARHLESELAFELAGGMTWVAEQLANGAHMRDVANRIGVTYWWLSCYIEADPARSQIIARARRFGASAKVAEAEAIADNLAGAGLAVGLNPADVAAAKLRADLRWRHAGKLDPDNYADKKDANSLNINVLHLNAVREINASPPVRAIAGGAAVIEAGAADYEVLPGQEAGTEEEQALIGQAVS